MRSYRSAMSDQSASQSPAAIDRSLLPVAGTTIFLGGLTAMGAVAFSAEPLAPFHDMLGPGTAAVIGGVALVILSLLALPWVPGSSGARLALCCFWLASLALLATGALVSVNVTNLVAMSEASLLAAAAFYLSRAGRVSALVLRLSFAAALILFGTVHLLYRGAIGAMIPPWIPFADWGPWLTGATMIAAGLASLRPRLVRQAGLAIACLFASWLPLVHAGRLIANPASTAEWAFALMAVTLIGASLIVAAIPCRHST